MGGNLATASPIGLRAGAAHARQRRWCRVGRRRTGVALADFFTGYRAALAPARSSAKSCCLRSPGGESLAAVSSRFRIVRNRHQHRGRGVSGGCGRGGCGAARASPMAAWQAMRRHGRSGARRTEVGQAVVEVWRFCATRLRRSTCAEQRQLAAARGVIVGEFCDTSGIHEGAADYRQMGAWPVDDARADSVESAVGHVTGRAHQRTPHCAGRC